MIKNYQNYQYQVTQYKPYGYNEVPYRYCAYIFEPSGYRRLIEQQCEFVSEGDARDWARDTIDRLEEYS